MTAYTDFHYSPTGSGVISGAQVLEQTEQGINGLGQYVQDNVSGAIDTANQALTIAQTADSNATLALNTANSFASAISAANNTANNALTTAQSAQSTANNASSLATTANNNANTALNAANTATSNVATLTNSVNALGNRMTTAENAISTNAGNITTLQTNLQTTNNNVTTAMNNASTAVATAQSAQQTATAAKNAAYVLRYTGTTITDGGTIAYADIDNTDNIKAGDKIIDISGAIYAIASVDIANQTVTVGASPVINLFCDAENLIPVATNTYDLGSSSYQWNNLYAKNYFYNGTAWGLDKANTWTGTNSFYAILPTQNGGNIGNASSLHFNGFFEGVYVYDHLKVNGDRGAWIVPVWAGATSGIQILTADGIKPVQIGVATTDANNRTVLDTSKGYVNFYTGSSGTDNKVEFYPVNTDIANLGTSANKWKTLNGINPGALSLPDMNTSTAVDTTGWTYDGATFNEIKINNATQTISGWLYIIINNAASDDVIVVRYAGNDSSNLTYAQYKSGLSYVSLVAPIMPGVKTYVASRKAFSTIKIYHSLGNV